MDSVLRSICSFPLLPSSCFFSFFFPRLVDGFFDNSARRKWNSIENVESRLVRK